MFTAIVYALMLLISFTGLCAAIRSNLKINRFFTPFLAVSGIICILMLAGMLHLLKPVCYVLYAAGFVGFVHTYFIRRVKPDYPLIAAMLVFSAMLCLCFYRMPMLRSDDFSHWGLVARHLLRYDAFPDSNAPWVHFQSYPLGSAVFIYYASRFIGNTEGMYLVAQMFLQGPLLLPLLAFINPHRKNCGAMYTVVALVFFMYFMAFRMLQTLLVDMLLSMFGIAITACILYYADDLKKALLTAVPGMIAIAYVKNSGLFFSVINAALLGYVAVRHTGKHRSAWLTFLSTAVLPVGAYMLWILHIKISYPAALDTKHAVSLSAYAMEASSKGISESMQILSNMVRNLFKFPPLTPIAVVMVLGMILLICVFCRKLSDGRQLRKRMLKQLSLCAGVYVLWLVMIFFMYVFSMPLGEALESAGLERYNGTGVFYLAGLMLLLLIPLCMHDEISALKPLRFMHKAAPVLCAIFVIASCIWQPPIFDSTFVSRSKAIRRGLEAARQEYQLQDRQKYMIFCDFTDPVMSAYRSYYLVKYEFETSDVQIIAEQGGEYAAGTYFDHKLCGDLQAYMGEYMNSCDALIMMHPSDSFETELRQYISDNDCSIPVIRAYEY